MPFILKILLGLYFILARLVLVLAILFLILDFTFSRISDGYTSPIVKSEGFKGVLIILLTSYFAWPYIVWVVLKRRKKN